MDQPEKPSLIKYFDHSRTSVFDELSSNVPLQESDTATAKSDITHFDFVNSGSHLSSHTAGSINPNDLANLESNIQPENKPFFSPTEVLVIPAGALYLETKLESASEAGFVEVVDVSSKSTSATCKEDNLLLNYETNNDLLECSLEREPHLPSHPELKESVAFELNTGISHGPSLSSMDYTTCVLDLQPDAKSVSPEQNWHYDAWIPSVKTQNCLEEMLSCTPGTYFPEKEVLTMPGIAMKEEFVDPIKNLVRTYLGEAAVAKHKSLDANGVTQDDRGLRELISAKCYHAAVNLTTRLLTVFGQGEGKAGHPKIECQYFGDLDGPDLYYEYYPELYGGRKGCMVPFYFRLLIAELPQYLGKHSQAMDRLNALLRTCTQILLNLNLGLREDGLKPEYISSIKEEVLNLWKSRQMKVIYTLVNCAVSMKDYCLAGELLYRLIKEDESQTANLYSALGCLNLMLGDITAAQNCFNCYLEHAPAPPHHDPVQGLLHSAYIAVAHNDFKDAVNILTQSEKLDPRSGLVVNNLGICLMYTGRINEAIEVMEKGILEQPEKFLHEGIILNLATMYELKPSTAQQNKLKLLSLVSQYNGDSFNIAALKLQSQ